MDFRYVEWDPERHGSQKPIFDQLLDLFEELLQHTAGDAQEALDWMEQLDERYGLTDGEDMDLDDFVEEMKRRGYLQEEGQDGEDGGALQMTARAERALRQQALDAIFDQLKKGTPGDHDTPHSGGGKERQPETRPYRFGDNPHRLDVTGTINNSFKNSFGRTGDLDDWTLRRDDFRVHQTEHKASMATVLMIDLSHSMVLYGEDRITPARKTALALAELIMTKYSKDTLDIVAFGNEAWEIEVKDLPYLEVGPYHTNTRAGLRRARDVLHRRRNANKQIFMITDGKPSCHIENGRLYKNAFGLDRKIVNKVLDEAVVCRREGIPITTFMIARDPYLQDFVQELTEANQGRAYYAGLDDLGEFMFEDYVRNRKRRIR
ncbi:MAG: hypothetical protein BRD37_02645 [Bacteroidetes bacterium QH_8_67_23]|jgi:uncharacterized protein with von Willebrand factor type A (vWA) domain|nr:MAG: hypothetical protein BRD37_02645 [Bacteroidetes bacterium QH_8_67_23]